MLTYILSYTVFQLSLSICQIIVFDKSLPLVNGGGLVIKTGTRSRNETSTAAMFSFIFGRRSTYLHQT